MTTTYPATERQLEFITTLSNERTVSDLKRASIKVEIDAGMSKAAASLLITWLMGLPKMPKPVAAAEDSPYRKADALLADIPRSRYAIEADDLSDWLTETRLYGNDTIFVEVRKYGQRIYLRHLQGESRAYFSGPDALAVAQYLSDQTRAREAAQRYGSRFRVCGKCQRELTDMESRRLSLGPDCRKAFGI